MSVDDFEKFAGIIRDSVIPAVDGCRSALVKRVLVAVWECSQPGHEQPALLISIARQCGASLPHTRRILRGLESLGLLVRRDDATWAVVWSDLARTCCRL